jgi:hypothetical protein
MDPLRPELVDDDTSEPLSSRDLRPIVLLALADHFTCTKLRGDLIERGHEAACVMGVAAAIILSAPSMLARASVFVVEDSTLSPQDRNALAWIRALDPLRAIVVITSRVEDVHDDGQLWDGVLTRPVEASELCDVVGALGDRAAAHDAAARRAARRAPSGFELRVGFPWPMVRCTRCSAARHCEAPRDAVEQGIVMAALVTFGLSHAHD